MWIHEHQNWINFSWDDQLVHSKLIPVRHHQGRFLGRLENLGFNFRSEATLETLTYDVVKSSAIEGETLSLQEVRSSIARRLGIDSVSTVPVSRHVEGIVEMMLDATQHFSTPLTASRLFNWHSALFPTGRSGINPILVGSWRTDNTGPMQVVSGPMGREKIHYQAPPANKIEREMENFLNWFQTDMLIDPVLKAGIAHFWFVTIHPFEDGNGRIARAIGDMALSRADGSKDRFYSLSAQIESERKLYYDQLEKQQRSTPDITYWLLWFLDCLERAIINAEKNMEKILFKARLWKDINLNPVNERQRMVINKMLETDFVGYMNTSKYASLAKCSNDTALRDIQDLKERGVFLQNLGGGRSTSYRLTEKV